MNINAFYRKNKPLIMGVLNSTPDSFSDGGLYFNVENALSQSKRLIKEGADILDIGGESSRPFSTPVPEEEELDRVIELIRQIRKKSDIPISIDTYKSKVAEEAIKAGANIVNDISGVSDETMIEVLKKYDVPVIVMHMLGNPRNMQLNPVYDDVVVEIVDFFKQKVISLKQKGIEKIILDPGIGFGKTINHNWEILRNLSTFRALNYPIMIGASRKKFLEEISGEIDPKKRDTATYGLFLMLEKHIDIYRVHEVNLYKNT